MAASEPNRRKSLRQRPEVKYYESDDPDSEDETAAETLSARDKARNAELADGKPLPKEKIFPFALLPTELRYQIYELTLSATEPVFLISKMRALRRTVVREVMTDDNASGTRRRRLRGGWPWHRASTTTNAQPDAKPAPLTPMVPHMLLLDKVTYSETQPILYGSNDFVLEDTTALHTFLAIIGARNVAALTDITVKGWGETKTQKGLNYPALTLLVPAVKLERFMIDCRIHYAGYKATARQLYREGHHWMEARGEAAIEAIDMQQSSLGMPRWGGDPEKGNLDDLKKELRILLGR